MAKWGDFQPTGPHFAMINAGGGAER